MRYIYVFLIGFIPLRAFLQSPTQVVQMNVVRIIDGDTFEGRAGNETYKVRLNGIDAPEKKQDFGNVCKQRLGELCAGGPVRVRLLKRMSITVGSEKYIITKGCR